MLNRRERFRMLATWSVAGLFALVPLSISDDGVSSGFHAHAQEVTATQIFADQQTDPDAQLLLESDQLIYDNDRELVIAIGNVQIAYDNYTLVANKVEYNRQSGRVVAFGNVEILEPNGNRIFAEEIDITDDFRDGFVSALKVETPDNTRIAAESAERRDGDTIFNNGVYTACEPCKENPEKPPFWQIRAKKVIINNRTRSIEYEDASFELFGKPIAKLARFSHADPAVKRKSGFLVPTFYGSEDLGTGVTNSYFFNLAPNYDITLSGSYFSRQGFLGEAEWRHRTENGQYNLRYAAIDQQDSNAFSTGTVSNANSNRQALMTNGLFNINSRWKFGWSALFQSDNDFANTYALEGFSNKDIINQAYLIGLDGKNYFDLRTQDFLVQDNRIDFDTVNAGNQHRTDQQATLLPLLDYNVVSGEEYDSGQVSFDLNVTSLSRGVADISNDDLAFLKAVNERHHGIEGHYTRASAETEWKGSHITSGGAVLTSSLSVRGDGMWLDTENLGSSLNPLTSNDSIFRAMPAAMFEIRYPLIATDGMTSHIFEPIAQIITRPDETDIGLFPNEDAQSLVFDTSNLFERDKYSGFDRVEGGTRANVGFRYSASFEYGDSIDVVAGQSFHLHGQNSFSQIDLVNAGLESGLETDRSDYVASIQYNNGQGVVLGSGVRLDESALELNRLEVGAQVAKPDYSYNTSYVFTAAQPNYRFPADRHEIRVSGSVNLNENWRAFGAVAYDIESSGLISDSIGLAYDDECFSFSANYSETRPRFTGEETSQSIGFRIGLRTIGGYGFTHRFNEQENQ